MLYRLTGWAIFEEQAQHGNILVETFQEAHKKQTLYAVIILLFASIGGVWFNDYSIVVLSLTAIIALFVHVLMTGYRVHRGFFGTNKTEADELICYVLKNSRNNRLPPGMRVARDLSRQTQSADPVGEAAGVPHKWM